MILSRIHPPPGRDVRECESFISIRDSDTINIIGSRKVIDDSEDEEIENTKTPPAKVIATKQE